VRKDVNLQKLLSENGLSRVSSTLGTDKDFPHTYIQNFYEGFFSLIDSPKKLIEIGIWKGASCALWKKTFPDCAIFGIDINIQELHPIAEKLRAKKEIELLEMDAYSEGLSRFSAGGIDLVIDDGPHTLESQILALNWIPLLTKAGTLIIEDVQNGILDMKRLEKSLPKELRKNSAYVSFTAKSKRYDDAIFVYSLSPQVLDFVRSLKAEHIFWGFRSTWFHYPYRAWMKLLHKGFRMARLRPN
jgi:predicted O-methyltransferase YrrM